LQSLLLLFFRKEDLFSLPSSCGSAMLPILAADEPAAFTVMNAAAAGPFVFTCDHASNRVPRALGLLGVNEGDLARHIGWDIGAAAVTAGLAARLDGWAILQNYSRLVIDCNRPPGVPSSIPVRSEATDIPGNIGLSAVQAEQRRAEIFAPYHGAIESALEARAARGQASILVTVHSSTPVYAGDAREMHAAVLYNRETRLPRALLQLLRAETGLIVGDNDPYSVSDESDYGINVHGEKRGLHCVELEIRQDLIADAAGQDAWVERLGRLLPLAVGRVKEGLLF
jgi:predicted N-formylglutamate amidohydrolase